MPYRHFLAVVLAYVGFLLEDYGTTSDGPLFVSLGALLISMSKYIE